MPSSPQQQHLPLILLISPANSSLLMPSRTRDTRRISPPFSRSSSSANKNLQRKTESAMHNAWRLLRTPSTVLLYTPGLRMVDDPPSSLLSSPKFFQSLTSLIPVARLARVVNSLAALLVFGLVSTQAMWWSFVQAIVLSLKQAILRTPSNATSTFTPARRRSCPIYVTTSLERDGYVSERLKDIGLGTAISSAPSSTDDSGSENRTVTDHPDL